MPSRDIDTRHISFVDIPLLRRMQGKYTLLDSELIFTRDYFEPNGPFLSSVLLPQRNIFSFVTRAEDQQVVGQFRMRNDNPNAQLIYLAPDISQGSDDTAWLHILDAMAREAGKQGVHSLLAEVDESSPLFEVLRTAGYAVYARQEIWRREVGDYTQFADDIQLREESEQDALDVQSLIATTVPGLVQQYAVPPGDMPRLVYRQDEIVRAYIAYSEGRQGIYIIPYIDPAIMSMAPDIIEAAIRQIPRFDRVPVFVCVRRYQDWVLEALAERRFRPCVQQAVMVKHITAGVHHARFESLEERMVKTAKPAKPPTIPMRQ